MGSASHLWSAWQDPDRFSSLALRSDRRAAALKALAPSSRSGFGALPGGPRNLHLGPRTGNTQGCSGWFKVDSNNLKMPIAWLLLQPVKMFVEGSKVSAVATMRLLLFRSLFFPQENFHLQKAQRKKSVNSKENLQRCLNCSVKKECESSSLFSHFFWDIHCIDYFPILCWGNNKINKGQKYFWPRNKA